MTSPLLSVLSGFCMALAITVVAEAAVAWLFGLRTWRMQLALALINVITNLTLNLAINIIAYFNIYIITKPFDPLLVAFEVFIVIAEMVMLQLVLKMPYKKAAVLSLAANAASFLAGVLILWN